MKKRILSLILAVTMVAGMVLSAAPAAFAEETTPKPIKTWTVTSEMLAAAKASVEAGAPTFPGEMELSLMHKWCSPVIRAYGYTTTAFSYFYGPNGSENTTNPGYDWRDAVQIPNNQGVGEGKNRQGVISRSDQYAGTIHTFKFTAPVDGIYNLVPLALGGADNIKTSVNSNLAVWQYAVSLNGTSVVADTAIPKGDSDFDFSSANNLTLKKGDALSVVISTSVEGKDGENGVLYYNFAVQLMDETVPYIPAPGVETVSFYMADALQRTDAQDKTANLLVWDTNQYDDDKLDLSKYSYLSGVIAGTGTTSYRSTYDPSSDYYLTANPSTKNIQFASKTKAADHMIQYTALFSGDFTISGTVDASGLYLKVNDDAPEAIAAGAYLKTVSLNEGESFYIMQNNTITNWGVGRINFKDLKIEGIQTGVYHEAVYSTTDVNVADEINKNNCSYDTSLQTTATGLAFTGIITPVHLYADLSQIVDPSETRIFADYYFYSAANNNNTVAQSMSVYKASDATDRFRFGYDYGSIRAGFKYTAEATQNYAFHFGELTALDPGANKGSGYGESSIFFYKYNAAGETAAEKYTLIKSVPLTGDAIDQVIPLEKDDVLICVIGKNGASWNHMQYFYMKDIVMSKMTLVSAAYNEPVESYVLDPDYTFVYKRDNIKVELKDADVSTKKEFTVDVSLTGFRVPYAGFAFKVDYDPDVLEVVKVEKGEVLGANDFVAAPKTDPLIIAYATNKNELEDGVVASITFKAKEGVVEADTTTVTPEILTIARVNDNDKAENIKKYVIEANAADLTFFECEHANVTFKDVVTEPTCEEAAHIAYYLCEDCGRKFAEETCDTFLTDEDVNTKAATGHDWEYDQAYNAVTGKWEHTATCNNGCGETIEATECTLGEWKASATAGKHEAACSVCNCKATEDCTSSHWTTETEPTWEDGSETGECDVCGAALARAIPAKTVSTVVVTADPMTKSYAKDGTFDPTGMKVTVTYVGGGTTVVTDFTDVTFTYDFSSGGTKTVTFTLAGESLSVDVTVSAGLLGDANGDGQIDTADATAILRYIIREGTVNEYNADCDGNEGIDTADATAILRYIIRVGTLSEPKV